MRTTLNISDDVLFAAREVARCERRTVGDVLSTWARSTRMRSEQLERAVEAEGPLARYGIHPMPRRGGVLTNEVVNRLRNENGN